MRGDPFSGRSRARFLKLVRTARGADAPGCSAVAKREARIARRVVGSAARPFGVDVAASGAPRSGYSGPGSFALMLGGERYRGPGRRGCPAEPALWHGPSGWTLLHPALRTINILAMRAGVVDAVQRVWSARDGSLPARRPRWRQDVLPIRQLCGTALRGGRCRIWRFAIAV